MTSKHFNLLWFTLIILFSHFNTWGQSKFIGSWGGKFSIQGMQMGLIFNIQQNSGQLSATMDSPDQGAKGIPVKTVKTIGDSVFLEIPEIVFTYKGKWMNDTHIDGVFIQRGASFPLNLEKDGLKPKIKSQTPQKPFPYLEKEVVFENKREKISLSGTLTFPQGKGPFPAIVLVSGSGPQDRNETILGHEPFLVLADFFTRNGFAVLRYDDRGVGQSKGNFETATTADFAEDAMAAVNFLYQNKQIDKKRIGIMGHSEGGEIATMLAAQNTKQLAFIVMLAGPGMSGDQILLQQQKYLARAVKESDAAIEQSQKMNQQIFEIMKSTKDTALIRSRVLTYLNNSYNDGTLEKVEGQTKEETVSTYSNALLSPWLIYFVQYNPQSDLQKIKIPVLALIGSKDVQVIPEYNIPALKSAFEKSGNKRATVLELEGLNHLFQEANTGLPQEYGNIEQSFSPKAMKVILEWLQKNVK
ncbi:MAG TPA: alpha/beta fold hydrolase [Edaphocola sp.]|nr:alpha/beta fold hydrolase [Edaphocola sp.]